MQSQMTALIHYHGQFSQNFTLPCISCNHFTPFAAADNRNNDASPALCRDVFQII